MATQDYTKTSTYTTPDGKRTAELDYQAQTLTVFENGTILTIIATEFDRLAAFTMKELRDIVEAAEPVTEEHTCDEPTERAAYRQYISDGLADTDGYYAPESFDAWRSHYHRAIGYTEPRTAPCTATECHAPDAEKVRLITHFAPQVPGKPRSRRERRSYESICTSCYQARRTR